MRLSDFDYHLPNNLIAQQPAPNRDASRLLIMDKISGKIQHGAFKDIARYIKKGDCLVLNNSRVLPARLIGKKSTTGSKVEFLLLKPIGNDLWEVMVKPGKHAKIGQVIVFEEGQLKAEVVDILQCGNRIVKFEYDCESFIKLINDIGTVPLPPYIHKELKEKERYQTVYSEILGSSAAPTAGLHFTDSLLEQLQGNGVQIAYITLHVGLGTFQPVKEQEIEKHKMHQEYFLITKVNCDKINSTKKKGNNIIAVGTTSCRVLESVADDASQTVKPFEGFTDIFIYPGYQFKVVDELITNFHVPKSTLMMLISAFAGRQNILAAYDIAIQERYRFLSLGDAMYIRKA